MNLFDSCEHNDEFVGPAAIRREPRHRVLGALELVGAADEGLALRGLVRLRGARKGRTEGSKREHEEDELRSTAYHEDCRQIRNRAHATLFGSKCNRACNSILENGLQQVATAQVICLQQQGGVIQGHSCLAHRRPPRYATSVPLQNRRTAACVRHTAKPQRACTRTTLPTYAPSVVRVR